MSDPFLGEIRIFTGNFAPRTWAVCNGQLLSINQNTALFSLLGTTYGGNGTTTFALPNLQSRVPIGMGSGAGLTARTVGDTLGAETVTLLSNQIPDHQHAQLASTSAATPESGPSGTPASSATTSFYGNGAPSLNMAPAAVAPSGGGEPHDNMAPYLTLNFVIALQGLFPARN